MAQELALSGAQLGALPITNTLLTGVLVAGGIVGVARLATRNMQLVPSGLQNLVEMVVEFVYNLVSSVEHSPRKVRLFFPFIATFFLFIYYWLTTPGYCRE